MSRSAAQPKPRPATRERDDDKHLKAVPDESPVLSTGTLGIITFAVVFAGLLGAVLFHSIVVAGQLELDELNDEVAAERARSVELRVQVAELEAPDRILREAARLGMVYPVAEAYVNGFPLGVEELLPPGDDPFSLDDFDREAAFFGEAADEGDEPTAGGDS